VGINNSQEEVVSWLKKGAEVAGLAWGVDFKLMFDQAPNVLDPNDPDIDYADIA